MSKIKIKQALRPITQNDPAHMGVDGLILAGVALLVADADCKQTWPEMVEDFHKKFGIEYTGVQRYLPKELNEFRIARNQEEFKEYFQAVMLEDKFDALIDQIYICLGTLHLHGFDAPTINEAFKRVHAANMKKVRASEANPGKYGSAQDIVKPKGWYPPIYKDLVNEPLATA